MKGETAIIASIVTVVNRTGEAFVWRNQSGIVRVKGGFMHLAPSGSPDVVGWTRDGRFVGFEVKVPNARTEKGRAERQAEWRARIIAAGGVAAQVTGAMDAIRALRSEPTPTPPTSPAPRLRSRPPLLGEQLLLIGGAR